MLSCLVWVRHARPPLRHVLPPYSPPTAMCKLVVNLHAPKYLWRTFYTLRKLEYHHTIPGGPYARPLCTAQDFQARWKELIGTMKLDDPVATVLPKATGISWPFSKYILPGWVRSIARSFLLTYIIRTDVYPVAGANGTQLTISLANFDRLARSPAGLWVLSMANCDDKAMDTLGTLWKDNWKVFLSPSAYCPF